MGKIVLKDNIPEILNTSITNGTPMLIILEIIESGLLLISGQESHAYC